MALSPKAVAPMATATAGITMNFRRESEGCWAAAAFLAFWDLESFLLTIGTLCWVHRVYDQRLVVIALTGFQYLWY